MNDLQTFNSDEFGEIHAYLDEDNIVWLNAADVARGLGFVKTEEKVSPTSGRKVYESIRWERVNGYLREFGFSPRVGKDDFIPENMFYRLAMKANNETAQKFQAQVSDVILPSIRQHGIYMTPDTIEKVLYNPDFIIKLATKIKQQSEQIAAMKPQVEYLNAIISCEDTVPVTIIAKEYGMSGVAFNKLLNSEQIQYLREGVWLLYRKYDKRGYTVTETLNVGNGNKMLTRWTQKGREFLYHFLKARGILPVRERAEPMATLF